MSIKLSIILDVGARFKFLIFKYLAAVGLGVGFAFSDNGLKKKKKIYIYHFIKNNCLINCLKIESYFSIIPF